MSEQIIKIARASDRAVYSAFKKVAESFPVQGASVGGVGFSKIGKIDLKSEPTGDWKSLLDHESFLISALTFQCAALQVTYHRGGKSGALDKSSIFDEITLASVENQNSTSAEKLALVAMINNEFQLFGRVPGAAPSLSAEQQQLEAIHLGVLERLERTNTELIEKSLEFREKLESRYEDKISAAETRLSEKESDLESLYSGRNAELQEKEKNLLDRLAAIDDRNNTHVRREIRDRMLDDVKQRIEKFGVSPATEGKRKPVAVGIFTLMAIFMALLIWTGLEVYRYESYSSVDSAIAAKIAGAVPVGPQVVVSASRDSAADSERYEIYWLWARFALFSFGIAATILYYIRWQNRWAEQHANSEFQLQQFYIDVNRANWVIESCLEWKKETDSSIPPELLTAITSNLFAAPQADVERVIHPADELASALMGSASRVKVRLGDSEVDFDKPGKIPNNAQSNSGSNRRGA